jgi:probable HAF family extracellular repeat protein
LALEILEERCLLSYSIVDLGTLPGYTVSTANAVNNAGQVAGYENTADLSGFHGFLYDGGSLIDLGTLGGMNSFAEGINDAGQIAGFSRIQGDAVSHAFLYDSGNFTDLGTLGGADSYAYAINSQAQVAGYAAGADGFDHAFIWDSNDGMQDVGTLGGQISYGFGINDSGMVVGTSYTSDNAAFHAFLAFDGRIHDLGTLGARNSWGSYINNAGQVVGYYGNSSADYRAFIWDRVNGMQDIGTLGGRTSYANGINDAGQVVGYSNLANGPGDGFLYSAGAMQDLNDLIPPDSGWSIYLATAINNAGQIVGQGYYQGAQHAYLMTADDGSSSPTMSVDATLADGVIASDVAASHATWAIEANAPEKGDKTAIAVPNQQDTNNTTAGSPEHQLGSGRFSAFRLHNSQQPLLPGAGEETALGEETAT